MGHATYLPVRIRLGTGFRLLEGIDDVGTPEEDAVGDQSSDLQSKCQYLF